MFETSAMQFYQRMARVDHPRGGDGSGKIDEFETLAVFAETNLSTDILKLLTIAQVAEVVGKSIDIKCGKLKSHEMSAAERRTQYGITPEKEQEIQAYLQKHPVERAV